MARQARGSRAVEGVDARPNGVNDVVHIADAKQVPRRLLGKPGERPADHLAHLLLLLAERATDRDAVHACAGHVGARLGPEVLVHPTLHDAVEQPLLWRMLAAPGDAAVEPAVRALHRAGRVLALHVEGRALVEGERDVGPERSLNLHRGLGAHEALCPVRVGAEAHALLLDREHHRLALVAAALDLLGDRAMSHREHLVAARVSDDRSSPPHELVQPAQFSDQFVTGLDEEMEGVAEHHVEAELGDLARVERLDRRCRGQRHERRRAHRPVGGLDHARAGGAVMRAYLEGGHAESLERARPPTEGGLPLAGSVGAGQVLGMRAARNRRRGQLRQGRIATPPSRSPPPRPAWRCRSPSPWRSRCGAACAPPASESSPRERRGRRMPRSGPRPRRRAGSASG